MGENYQSLVSFAGHYQEPYSITGRYRPTGNTTNCEDNYQTLKNAANKTAFPANTASNTI